MNERKYRVLWTELAVHDLEDIIVYIARDSPRNARSVLARLKNKAASLEALPFRGRIAPELTRSGVGSWRELVVKPYRIIYRVESECVYVLAVLDARRDLEDLLLERLVRTT